MIDRRGKLHRSEADARSADVDVKNQFRACDICGKVQSRKLRCGIVVTASAINEVLSEKSV